jgi:hypothetical protein
MEKTGRLPFSESDSANVDLPLPGNPRKRRSDFITAKIESIK